MRRCALVLLVALATSIPSAHAAGPVRIVVGVIGSPADPIAQREVDNLQHPTVTALAADTLDTVPGLAEAWVAVPDGWAYTLRAGAAWSDGTPVRADDVVYSLEQQREHFPLLTATAVDDRTVVIEGRRDPGLLLNVRPRDPARGAAGDWEVVESNDQHVTMRVVERPGRPRLDEIVFRFYPDAEALLDALDKGSVDVAADLPPSEYDRIRELDDITAIHANDGDQWILQVRIDDANVRRAVARAIDRDRLVAEVANGVGRTGPIPVVARGTRWQVDPETADTLADRVSYDPSAMRVEASVSIATTGEGDGPAIADFVTDALSAIGIDAEPTGSATSADITVALRDPGDDPAPVLAQYTCAGTIWCDVRYDTAYDVYTSTGDVTTRIDAVHEMVELLASEAVEVVLFEPDVLQGFRTNHVTGMLREPRDERLVVLWPSIEQYYEAVPTSTLGGEDIPDTAFAAIAVAVTVATLGILAIPRLRASGRRRREMRSRP